MRTGLVIFLGGVHGVGKSTLAALCKESGVEHLRASDLIKQASSEARFDERKRVKDVDGNQGILVRSLNARIAGGGKFLLDGHFTLFNTAGEIEEIPLATFQAIQPVGLGVVVDTPEVVIARLQARDKVGHDLAAFFGPSRSASRSKPITVSDQADHPVGASRSPRTGDVE